MNLKLNAINSPLNKIEIIITRRKYLKLKVDKNSISKINGIQNKQYFS